MTLILLVAGLWPFNPFPENQVTWLRTDKALEFGGHAVALSSHSVPAVHSNGRAFCSLEIRLQPRFPYLNNSGTLLVFYTPENPLQFRLMQYRDELLVRRDYRNDKNQVKTVEIELEHVFTGNEPVSFAVTSGPAGSVAYRNGVPVGTSTRMGLSCHDFSGQLVLGNSPVSDDPWQGKLYGLAIYDRELTPEEVWRDSAAGVAEEARQPDEKERVIARYGFAEGSGKIVHNTAGPAPDLYIPDVFRILHKKFLMSPSEESQDKLELRDILINIVGFIPFGFLLFAYLSWHTWWNRAAFLTILTGAAMSLTIEVLQVFIPARSSGITDIITNTLGTFLGVLLFRWRRLQALAMKKRVFAARAGTP
jgi:VanZ family protein